MYYTSKWIHRIQTCWIATAFLGAIVFIRMSSWTLWLSIPTGVVGFLLVAWFGVGVISMFDYNHRMCARYGVKIENLPLYLSLYERLMEMEARGEDSSGIPKEVDDVDDWIRFCQWQASEAMRQLYKIK